ncbi:SprT-like family protein [Pelagibacteraceae bacterium]|nr:SprT-like family protein [Candidatus Pelagibacter bacterium]MDA9794180.1 SprT-like family protein [Candidatus Pelagibacter sp.]MDC1491116.1 SprT-like family protein [Pelagibacteraceae bacterium]
MPKKKKNKDNYIVRTKKRILRETTDSEAKYKTTFKDIRTYFKIFNKSLFKNELNPFNDVKIKRIVRGSGQCVEYISYRKGTNFFVLEMMPKYKNKMEFLNTLSHEMVHLWQQTIKKDTGNHNKLFFSFRNKFKKLNLKLSY